MMQPTRPAPPNRPTNRLTNRLTSGLAAAIMGVTLAALPCGSASAQESGSFIIRARGDTIAVENFERTSTQLHGTIEARGGGKGEYTATLKPDGLVSKLILLGSSADGHAATRGVLTFVGDTVLADVGQGTVQRVATQPGAEPWVNLSFAFTELLARRALIVGRPVVQIPLFVTQGGRTVPATVTRLGRDSLVITLSDVTLRVRIDSIGRILGGSVPAQGVVVERVATNAHGKRAQLSPPDYSAPAGAPYLSEQVRIPTPGGFTLVGTLTLPKQHTAPMPAALTITGSGPNDRDETIAGVPGYRPFRQIADTLGRRGIAVLRLDDRGYGESGGNPSQATTADLADDTRAGLAYLRGRRDIDSKHLFLVGHSEGGIIAPLVAWTDPSLRGIVLMAGAARTGMEIMRAQNRYSIDHDSTIAATARDSAMKVREAMLAAAAASQPWTRFFASYNPSATARKVRTPVLILQGGNDHQVSPDQAEMLEAIFRSGGNKDVTTRVFPGLDHLFLNDPTGNWTGYAALPSRQLGPAVLGAIADWISTRAM